jgi:histone deacetylase 1/2
VDYHFVREKVVNKDILLQHVLTSLQPADIFTKGHTADQFCYLRDKLSVTDVPASLWGNDKDKVHNTKIDDKHWDLLPSVFHF